MKILQISLYYHPDKTGIAVTSTEVAEWLVSNGNQVTVLTGPPFYPDWKVDPAYKKIMEEDINGVKVLRTKLYVPGKITTITRILHELSFMLNVFLKSFFLEKPDVIILVTPPLTVGIIAIWLKFFWKIRLFLNVKDLVPDAAIELNMLTNKGVIKLMYKLEKWIYNNSDKVASLGYGVLKRIENKGIPVEKLIYLPDTADPLLLNAPVKEKNKNPFIKGNNIEEKFLVLHSGNMGIKQGIDVIIESAKLIKNEKIVFYIVGNGVVRDEIIALAKKYKLTNVKFLPLQPREWLADMYHASDLCLLTQKAEVVDIVVPSKLISMMAAGACIIASANEISEGAQIIKNAECGEIVIPENAQQLADKVLFYYENRDLIPKARANSKAYIAKHFDRDSVMTRFTESLSQLIN